MKINIGPYKTWFGPYQLAEAICFWAKPVVDNYGISSKPIWVHSFGEWLAHGSIEPEPKVGEVREFSSERHNTLLYRLLLWIDSKKKRKVRIQIDRWDTWSMCDTLAMVILPMLKGLKERKQGAPAVDDEDVPEELRSTSAPAKEHEWDTDDNYFKRWDYVLDEMIFAFENIVNTDWEDQFSTGESHMKSVKLEDGNFQLIRGENDTRKTDYEGMKAYNKRIDNGTRLFGKYYRNLWA